MHTLLRLAAGTAITTIAAGSAVMAATPDDTMVMAWNIDAMSTLDPAQIGEVVTNEIILNTCDALVRHDMTNEANTLPALAESWDVSDDGLQVTFHLVEDAVFPSGNPMTAEDLAWSMQRVLKLGFGNSATLTEYGFTAETAEEQFVAADDHTLVMNLSKPYPIEIILQAVASNRVAMALDKKLLLENEQDGDLGNGYLTTQTACVGPYHVRQWNAGEVVVLEANENYHGEKPALNRWIIRHVPEAGAQRLLLEQGDIDVARNLGAEDLRELESNEDVALESNKKHQMFYMAFDNAQERFADDRVRLAFKYMIDYDGLGETVMAYDGVPRNQVVPFGAYGALDEEEGKPFYLDLDKAKALLEEAGYGDGFEAKMNIGSLPYNAPVAQHIQENASKLGITLDIEQMANAQLFSSFRGRDFDTLLISWSTSVPHAHGMLARHAVNPDNSEEAKLTMYPTWRASWYKPEFNEKIEAALFETDKDKQLQMYRELQEDHMQHGPFAYMFQITDNAAMRNNVDNWQWHAFRTDYGSAGKN
ncbi:MAG: ABC transporter substrate-binding protein [Pseudomonadota bacterium]